MNDDATPSETLGDPADLPEGANPTPGKTLTPAALRALEEAARRRADYDRQAAQAVPVREIDGRKGLEPVRYGDWELKGITSDF